jgi:CRP/FNR family cyclic AMP-dependent transcriptional regulator
VTYWSKKVDKDAACAIALNQGWLRQTPLSFRRAVLDRCRLEQFKAGATVFSVGDEPGGIYGIVSGCLGISVAPRELGPYTAHLVMPGFWFGQAGAFTRGPRRGGVTATRDSELLHLPLRAIDAIVKHDPSTWRLFALPLFEHLEIAIGGSDDLMQRNHVNRFVAVLLRLGNCRLASPRNRGPIEIDMKQEDLAHMANISRTKVGAILRKLQAEGHLALSYRRINILAPDALRKMLRD